MLKFVLKQGRFRCPWNILGSSYETHLSAQRHKAQAESRFPSPYEYPRRSGDHQCTPGPGAGQAQRLENSVAEDHERSAEWFRMVGFGRCHRIVTPRQYRDVFDNRSRHIGQYFTIFKRANTVGFSRLGLAVSRKVSKSAVKRNQIKRVIRESFRHSLAVPPRKKDGMDVVVLARPTAAKVDTKRLRGDLDQLWRFVN